MTKETSRTMLKIITGCDYIHFTTRCNRSIEIAMNVLKELSITTVLYQEEGGWLTYKKYISKADLEPIMLVTDDGIIYEKEVARHDIDSALIVNSLPGYIAVQDMTSLSSTCLSNDIFLINDVSGSIGLPESKLGDIIVGSFGNSKPINLGSGGFIATNNEEIFKLIQSVESEEPDLQFILLEKKLRNLDLRRSYLQKRVSQVKEDLLDSDIVHRDKEGLNVVVRYETDDQKQYLIDYCKKQELEFTECPREIRILDNAISIEIKRLT